VDARLLDRYASAEGAAAYRRKYERSLARRWSNRRERAIVGAALRAVGPADRALDCPCGAGRLTPTVLRHASRVDAVDLSPAMVEEARDALADISRAGRVAFAVASASALPFEDGAFDVVLCHRLIHHVADPAERAAILSELARVTRGHLVLCFNDAETWKARWQRRRAVPRRRVATTIAALDAEAGAHGLTRIGRVRRLNGLFSLVAVATYRRTDARDPS
jgi:SAM-dependent methyltransferase